MHSAVAAQPREAESKCHVWMNDVRAWHYARVKSLAVQQYEAAHAVSNAKKESRGGRATGWNQDPRHDSTSSPVYVLFCYLLAGNCPIVSLNI